jgi:hypothetical protein
MGKKELFCSTMTYEGIGEINSNTFSHTSIGRGAPKVENPALPGENVTLPGSVIPWIPHRPA